MSEPAGRRSFSISLQAALLVLVALALLAGVVPAGIFLDRWVEQEVETRVRRDVELAPVVLADRNRAVGDAFMMHAKDVAQRPALVQAMAEGDEQVALRVADEAARSLQRSAVLVDGVGTVWQGPAPPGELVEATRRGEMPVSVVADTSGLYVLGLAPVESGGAWIAAAGVSAPLDEAAAGALAALARADLVIVMAGSGQASVLSASNFPDAAQVRAAVATRGAAEGVDELRVADRRYLLVTAPFAGATVTFVRDLTRELAILPQLRRVLGASGLGALLVALALASVLALALLRPVRVLAHAAERLTGGDFATPLPSSPVRELERVSESFGAMRSSLEQRLDDLSAANRLLEDRQSRLAALQSELIRRERVAVSARMVAELAHEIRNPVANLRNCLELIYRRLGDDPQGREYAAIAIDELLRMHELAERMLDLHRPHDAAVVSCDAAQVARDAAALTRIGKDKQIRSIEVRAVGETRAAIGPDALKQVLFNLLQNACEAKPTDLEIELDVRGDGRTTFIEVADNGPGVDDAVRPHVFDPFFTTRSSVGGVGLGLFVVEGIVRAHGGDVSVRKRPGGGALFGVSLPAVGAESGAPETEEARA